MQVDWMFGVGIVVTSVLAALAGLLALATLQAKTSTSRGAIFADAASGTTFLFDGDTLLDATPGARALLSLSPNKGAPWARLLAYLAPRFPGFETRFSHLPGEGRITLATADNAAQPLMLRAELRGGLTRITLIDTDDAPRVVGFDPLTHSAMEDELNQLRATISHAPLLIWREAPNGDVVWANAAYLMKATQTLDPGQDLTWPLPRVFEKTATAQGAASQRQKLEPRGGGAPNWYELTGFDEGENRLLFGTPADGVVQAEGSLRDFMQTLTKTFAHLPIALAIFDKQRQLALFNPALLDLSGLQPDFLSMRPTLFAFLDAMRNRNMIPEPKDYHGWRKQMMELEQAAASGLYEETWSLPSGQTYRVIGRPHPNGALALMFEDISNEMSRTRRYRADLELGQSVIDAIDQALAVFSNSGVLVVSNAAYARLWGHDPATMLTENGISTLCAYWRENSAASSNWAEAESFASTLDDRQPLSFESRLNDGRLIDCKFTPLPGGATLASFKCATPPESQGLSFVTARHNKTA